MAEPTDLELRRQGMADAVVAITMTRRLPTLTVEEIGSWVGLRQREVIAAIKRMKNGDELVRRLITSTTGPRTSTEIRLEIDQLKAELAATVKAETIAERERRQQARAAEGRTIPAESYKDAGPCPDCGKPVRNMGAHRRSHRTRYCDICDTEISEMAWGNHRKRHDEEHADAA